MKKIVTLILALLAFSGCSQKVVFRDRLVCSEQLVVDRPTATLRVFKDDLEVAKAYKESLDASFNFYEEQVNVNNNMCKEK